MICSESANQSCVHLSYCTVPGVVASPYCLHISPYFLHPGIGAPLPFILTVIQGWVKLIVCTTLPTVLAALPPCGGVWKILIFMNFLVHFEAC